MNTFYEPTPRSEKLMMWLCSLVAIAAVIWVLQWSAERDEKLMTWADAYEKCVMYEYRTTPTEWYWSHNKTMPECDPKPYYEN